MGKRHLATAVGVVALLCNGGCCINVPRDISRRPDVAASSLVGKCLELTDDRPLVRLGGPYARLVLYTETNDRSGGPGRRLGTLTAGTRLRVERVVRATT